MAGSRRRARACARWRCPPRLARMIVDSHRLGAAEDAAEIAAVLTERGLGGDSVDLDARLDQFRRDRSQRASSARSLAQRWASQVAASEDANAAVLSSPLPLAGEGRGGGSLAAAAAGATPTPDPSPQGGGEQKGSRNMQGSNRRNQSENSPPASCSPWHFRTVSRATAAMAASCSPTGAAPLWTRPPRWRARPISRWPN